MSIATDSVTLTIRCIRSFDYRVWKPFVMRVVNLDQSTEDFIKAVKAALQLSSLPPPLKNSDYDTMKIEFHKHGHKSNDPLINLEEDDASILKSGKTLREQGVEDETEISFFKLSSYLEYKKSKSSIES